MFKQLISSENREPKSVGASHCAANQTAERAGQSKISVPALLPERWVELEDPSLCGQIDLVVTDYDGDHVVDFKTGVEDPEHLDQIDYYSFLWAKAKNRRIKQRTIVYWNGKRLSRGDLSTPELKMLESRYKARFSAAMSAISDGPKPVPSVASCSYCAAKQLCDSYWSSPETLALRWDPLASGTTSAWTDFELPLRDCTTSGHALYASVLGTGGKQIKLSCILPERCILSRREHDTTLRLLNVLLRFDADDEARVVWGAFSEAYWK